MARRAGLAVVRNLKSGAVPPKLHEEGWGGRWVIGRISDFTGSSDAADHTAERREGSEEDEDRRALVGQMLGARTPEEIRAAWRAKEAWLNEHPDDALVLDAEEQLKIFAGRWG